MNDLESLKQELKSIPFFQTFSDKELTELAPALQLKHFAPEERIFSYEEAGDALYIVKSGRVELFIRDYSGDRISLKMVEEKDYFGELSLFDGGSRTANAVAVEPTDCYFLMRADFINFLRRQPNTVVELLSALSQIIRKTNVMLSRRVTRNVNMEIDEELSFWQRTANFIAAFSGSIPFLLINALWFFVWIYINLGYVSAIKPFDPYPFGFLTLAVSLEAIFLSIFVLLSQNLQAAKEQISRDIEYEVNLKAELEIANLHEKIDAFQEENIKLLQRILQDKK